jgi:cytochrome c-type biogenesis protein CcmH/NrfF
MISSFRHPRESGDPGAVERFARLIFRWVPAFAGMTMMLGVWALPAAAQDLLPPAPYAYRQIDDPALEAKAQALMETLRCLKCQSQSIADSDAPMAGDMRHQVRTRIAAGEDPEAVRAWLVERYGDYVSYKPTVSSTTWPLFAIPLVLLALVGLILWRRLGRAR